MKKDFKKQCESLGYAVYSFEDVIDHLPKQVKGKIELFNLGKSATPQEVQYEYAQRGLVPADPYSLLEFLEEDKTEYVASQWQDKGFCYAGFDRSGDERGVYVDRNDSYWLGYIWFAGRRKVSSLALDTQSSSESLTLELEIRIEALEKQMSKLLEGIRRGVI